MAIKIAETREPFTAASEPVTPTSTTSQASLAESSAYRRLCSELTRYVKREINGRSFLVSGHRGAGKTTVVLKAIEDTLFTMRNVRSRPLMIPLHGPDLLLPPEVSDSAQTPAAKDAENAKAADPAKGADPARGADGAKDAPSADDTDKNADKKTEASPKPTSTPANGKPANGKKAEAAPPASTTASDTEQFLRQVTIGIYRALADLFHDAYRRAAESKAKTGHPTWRDLPELAAQLRIELDGAPDMGLLREFWRRAGALEDGIIALAEYEKMPIPAGVNIGPLPSPRAKAPNMGMLELVALSSASQADKVVSGKLETTNTNTQGVTDQQSLALQTVGQVKNLLNPLLGALAGGAVGFGLKSAVPTMVAALAGTATGLGTALTLNYSSSRSRENTRSTEMMFLPDNSITSLDRVLPLLVERCRQAGIAPVFVVDELDKVSPTLAERMGPLVRHLKSLVTEKSFFCFLADRSYLERLRRDLVNTPYRTEYTYFSDRLFVLYRPRDLHKYLSSLLQQGPPSLINDLKDQGLLPYVVLHRSRMHPFDLRRQLGRMRNDQGNISLPESEWAYRFDILIQVAVEWLLDREQLRDRLSQDEDFTQLVYDTLYYPSRKWEQGSPELDVSRKAFFTYLNERMSPDLGQNKNKDNTDNQEEDEQKEQPEKDCPLSVMDRDFLYARLRELLGFLVEPDGLLVAIRSTSPKRFPAEVLDAIPIPVGPKFRLLDYRDKTRDICVWRRDLFGRPVEKPGINVVKEGMEPREKFIQSMQAALSAVGQNVTLDRLANEFSVLRSTPAWTSVQAALRRLKRLWTDERPEPYPDMDADSDTVWEYSRMLQSSGAALAEALIAGMILGQINGAVEGSGPNTQEQKILLGLPILSGRLGLRRLSSEETAGQLLLAVGKLKTALGLQFDEAS